MNCFSPSCFFDSPISIIALSAKDLSINGSTKKAP